MIRYISFHCGVQDGNPIAAVLPRKSLKKGVGADDTRMVGMAETFESGCPLSVFFCGSTLGVEGRDRSWGFGDCFHVAGRSLSV